MVGLAAVQGWQRARLPQNQGETCGSAEGGKPIPGAETCNGHAKAVAGGRHGLEDRCRSGGQSAGSTPRALVTHATDVHAAGLASNTPGKWLVVGVEAPAVSSCFGTLSSHCQQTTAYADGGGLNHYQGPAADAFQPPLGAP